MVSALGLSGAGGWAVSVFSDSVAVSAAVVGAGTVFHANPVTAAGAVLALGAQALPGKRLHFVSNVDGHALDTVLRTLRGAGNAVPVAVISYGKNRAGTVDRNGLRFGDATASAREKGQAIGQSPAMLYGRVSEAVQEFDDEVLVLPALLLANRASLGGYPVVRQPAASGS